MFNGIKSEKAIATKSRFTRYNLTGCLNIIDSQFNNAKIEVDNSSCEDALNIVNSRGNLDLVKVNNTLYDALDVDFSELFFKNITINNSNNDCLDLSYGKYSIEYISTSECYDKSISLGEASSLKLAKFHNKNSKVGIAVKDSSIAWIDSINNTNSTYCVLAYRKKQEFSGGQVFLGKSDCNIDSIQKDNQSSIVLNNEF